jgi:hypothetical protein
LNVMSYFSDLPKQLIIFLLIYAFSLSGAFYNHVSDIIKFGFLPYHQVPLWLNIYWTSLTFIEPIAIIAIVLKKNIGIYLCMAIIVSDVIINFFSTLVYFGGLRQLFDFRFICQVVFMAFVLSTYKDLLKRTAK